LFILSLSRGKRTKKKTVDRDKALLITSSVPAEKGFHFSTDPQKPTGNIATSIFDFLDEVKKIDVRSIDFHSKRGDFSKWLREVIKDDALANDFERLSSLAVTGEELRQKIVEVTEMRCKELANELKGLAR